MFRMADQFVESKPSGNQKKKGLWKYVIYVVFVLVATGVSLLLSLWGSFDDVLGTFRQSDWGYNVLVFAMVFLTYCLEGLILVVFCRLYTRKYKFHQGLACSMVGQFYSNVTPGASGGQVMQAYTLKSQGIIVSNAASIMVMWFILYQSALIFFGVLALGFEFRTVGSLNPNIGSFFGSDWTVPMWPLIIIGFMVNLSVILMLLFMSYSHHFHNFILRHVIGFLGKIHILKKPDETRESLRVQVENFKIELRRLQSNIPVLILLFILFFLLLLLRFSIPYFCGMAMHAWGEEATFHFYSFDPDTPSMLRASFLTSFHQMVTGLIPLPGSAGVSELFYNLFFKPFFANSYTKTVATQILWRFATFHLVFLVSGFVSAFYHSRGGASVTYASRKTFVTLQLETYDERKRSSDTMYETSQFSRKELQRRLSSNMKKRTSKEIEIPFDDIDDTGDFEATRMKIATHKQDLPKVKEKKKKEKPEKPAKKSKKRNNDTSTDNGWTNWEI